MTTCGVPVGSGVRHTHGRGPCGGALLAGSLRPLDALRIEVTSDNAIPLRATPGVGEDLVRDPIQCIMEVSVTATTVGELSGYCRSPSFIEQPNEQGVLAWSDS